MANGDHRRELIEQSMLRELRDFPTDSLGGPARPRLELGRVESASDELFVVELTHSWGTTRLRVIVDVRIWSHNASEDLDEYIAHELPSWVVEAAMLMLQRP